MISELSLTEALAADLRDLLIIQAPLGGAIDPTRILLQLETGDLPSPRIVILCGDSRRVQGQDFTARIPISIDVTTPLDRVDPETHRNQAGKIDKWLINLTTRRRSLLSTRVYLHDIYTFQPKPAQVLADRESTTTLRAEAIVTLAEVSID